MRIIYLLLLQSNKQGKRIFALLDYYKGQRESRNFKWSDNLDDYLLLLQSNKQGKKQIDKFKSFKLCTLKLQEKYKQGRKHLRKNKSLKFIKECMHMAKSEKGYVHLDDSIIFCYKKVPNRTKI